MPFSKKLLKLMIWLGEWKIDFCWNLICQRKYLSIYFIHSVTQNLLVSDSWFNSLISLLGYMISYVFGLTSLRLFNYFGIYNWVKLCWSLVFKVFIYPYSFTHFIHSRIPFTFIYPTILYIHQLTFFFSISWT